MWALRAYSASVSQSGQQWSGFSNGQLQTGVDANGAGVTIRYISTCATARGTSQSKSSSLPSAHGFPTTLPSPSSTPRSSSDATHLFDASVTHKSLAPISLALLLPTIILYRLSLPSSSGPSSQQSQGPLYVSVLMLVIAYGTGLTALTSSFTSISRSSAAIGRRAASSNMVLKTSHGQAGLALFVALYGIVPLFFLAYFVRWRLFASSPQEIIGKIRAERSRADSSDTAEKLNSFRGVVDKGNPGGAPSRTPASSPGHTSSRRYLGFWFRSREGLASSSEGAPESESPVPNTFEVVNRPARMRHHSASGTLNIYESAHRSPPRNLSDLSWLERRRSVNAVVRTKPGVLGLAEVKVCRVIWTMP